MTVACTFSKPGGFLGQIFGQGLEKKLLIRGKMHKILVRVETKNSSIAVKVTREGRAIFRAMSRGPPGSYLIPDLQECFPRLRVIPSGCSL